ncbi:sugar isomerase domain-containing protein [Cohnella rhizosphaerae]|uniref:Sugar isomerase domain-containing protein n=1 Tax=Cohnella rhizosphaerae TaxID=1457232 RepID=A0A9X4KUG2_9BACL|nr:sugar isomerase domain-containing protein [Cohnella rhizosphaerae]MDG0810451.1 sugar isomerase domain-containing protein [Cohnella rhizosphaerae]
MAILVQPFDLKQVYFQKINALIRQVEETQSEAIEQASALVADAIAHGKGVHVFDTGHMLDSELIDRAGGLYSFKRLALKFELNNDVRKRPQDGEKDRSLEGLMKYALKSSNVHPGDVLIIGSVSGKTVFPVDLAIEAGQLGVTVIALTSLTYSRLLESDHSSGKRLFELADLAIDNCAPALDAMIEAPGMDAPICPASGIASSVIMWAIEARTVQLLLERGIQPTVLKSINNPGSDKFNDAQMRRYQETGH